MIKLSRLLEEDWFLWLVMFLTFGLTFLAFCSFEILTNLNPFIFFILVLLCGSFFYIVNILFLLYISIKNDIKKIEKQ